MLPIGFVQVCLLLQQYVTIKVPRRLLLAVNSWIDKAVKFHERSNCPLRVINQEYQSVASIKLPLQFAGLVRQVTRWIRNIAPIFRFFECGR